MLATKLLRNFWLFSAFVLLLFFSLLSHTEPKSEKTLYTFAKITKIPSLGYSTSFLEQRVVLYNDAENRLYPQMCHFKKMDFVYVR